MKILYLSQLIPYPLDAGPKVRSYHTLQYLSGAGHQVTLVAFERPEDLNINIEHLSHICHDVHTVQIKRSRARDVRKLVRSLLSSRPFLISRDEVEEMHLKIRELLTGQAFDAIHADQLWMAQYALEAWEKSGLSGKPRMVLDQHNAVYLIPYRMSISTSNPLTRILLARESRKLAQYEIETCQQFDYVVWVTEDDRRALATITSGTTRIREDPIIPICVDLETRQQISLSDEVFRVTFLGGMHWPPNAQGIHWFFQEVWPIVQKKFPNSVLTVLGKNPPPSLRNTIGNLKSIDVTGYVEDPMPYLLETAVFIVPLHSGGGMRVKIVDAWSWGLPVVSTVIGAEGIAYNDGFDILIANSPEEFADAVATLLQNREFATRLSVQGRKSVEANYDWRKVYKLWDRVYSE